MLEAPQTTVKRSEQPRPTLEQFIAHCRKWFGFLSEFGFRPAPNPQREFTNEFQTRFTNGNLVLVVEGINWGFGADAYFEDTAGARVPLVLFVPREDREVPSEPLPTEPQQVFELRMVAKRVRENCGDLLRGDMTRFYDRDAEWRRMTGRAHPEQKRVLP
jgi:hypothetical protein